jgi:catechol 2,3-dioxygenase-like lactoylglutathione lyase family enzyme
MSITPLHHVVLSVTDMERSLAFYGDVLGFRPNLQSPVEGYEGYLHMPAGSTGRMAMLAAGDERSLGMIELIQWDVPGGVEPKPPKRPGDPGVFMLALEVHDEKLTDVVARWDGLDVMQWSPITPVNLDGYPEFSTMIIEDPDGLLIELIELPSRDEIRAFRQALREAATAGDAR